MVSSNHNPNDSLTSSMFSCFLLRLDFIVNTKENEMYQNFYHVLRIFMQFKSVRAPFHLLSDNDEHQTQ